MERSVSNVDGFDSIVNATGVETENDRLGER